MMPLGKQARIAGSLYLLDAIAAPLRLIVIPDSLFVAGNAGATAANIAAHEALFRAGMLADLFAGLWLLPLAMLVLRCGFLPRFLGYWLYANGIAYVLVAVMGWAAPALEPLVASLAFPAQVGEVAFLLWLLARGASWRRPLLAAGP